MRKFDFSYDKANDDLFIHSPNAKSKGSVEFGDLILDFDSKREFVGIQIMNASKMIRDLIADDTPPIKTILTSLESCKVEVKQKNGMLIIKILLISKVKEIAPVISVPSIMERSPALAYA